MSTEMSIARGSCRIRKFFPSFKSLESMGNPHVSLAVQVIGTMEDPQAVDIQRVFDHMRIGIGEDGIARDFVTRR